MSRNRFAEEGRARKVSRLLAIIDDLEETPRADDVARWCSKTWAALTDTANAVFDANMDPPSAASRALVIEELRRREAHRRAS